MNYLGGIGSGKKFEEAEFNEKYSASDPMGFEKNLEAVVITIVNSIINTGVDLWWLSKITSSQLIIMTCFVTSKNEV